MTNKTQVRLVGRKTQFSPRWNDEPVNTYYEGTSFDSFTQVNAYALDLYLSRTFLDRLDEINPHILPETESYSLRASELAQIFRRRAGDIHCYTFPVKAKQEFKLRGKNYVSIQPIEFSIDPLDIGDYAGSLLMSNVPRHPYLTDYDKLQEGLETKLDFSVFNPQMKPTRITPPSELVQSLNLFALRVYGDRVAKAFINYRRADSRGEDTTKIARKVHELLGSPAEEFKLDG